MRGDSSSGASDSIGACGARIAPLEHLLVLVVVVALIVVVVHVPATTTVTEARKERESVGGLKGRPERRELSAKAKSRC